LNTVSYRLASLRTEISAGQGLSAGDEVGEGKNFWFQGFGTYADQSERQGIQGFEARTGGFAFGTDKAISNTFLLGLSSSYSYTDVDSRLSENQTYINSYQGTVYGTYDFGDSYLDAQLGLAYNDYAAKRFISVGAVDRQANADYEGYQFLSKFELGRDLTLPNELEFTPSIGLSWMHVEINNYTETGAGTSNLIVNDQDYDILNFSLRGELRRTFDISQGSLTPEVHLGYNYEAIDDQIQTVAAFTGGGNTFQSTGFDPANHSATGGAGLSYSGSNFDLVATYDFEAKQDFVSHSALLKGRWNF
jgi:outer membrane autotransporter protein